MDYITIGLARLQAQHTAQADFETPADVVRHMGAMQAQDYAGAKWSIGLRMRTATAVSVEQAVADRTILRTWPQRGTIHFVVPEEVRWRLMLSASRKLVGAERRHQNLGLTQSDFTRALELLRKALQGGKYLSRPVLMQVLQNGGVATVGQRGYHILKDLAQAGHLCFGPLEGKQPTFALLDEWVPKTPEIERDEALHHLVRKYFISHGPASVQDAAWWSGLTMADIKKGLALAAPELESVVVSGTTYHFGRGLEPVEGPSAFLLPGFDEFVLGYKDRSAVLPAEYAQRICPGGNGMFLPTIVVNGQITGTWKRPATKATTDLIYTSFDDNPVQMQDSPALKKYLAYLS